jgi:catechol 2,3-dioxygenase-like lactoylglutathione lyase family enzyme
MTISRITSQLRTTDIESTIRFYVDVVGLSVDFRYSDFYAGLGAGQHRFHLKLSDEPDPSIPFVRAEKHFHLYLDTNDVDVVAERLRSHGVVLRQDPIDTEWGTRELVFEDDQGHTIYVGQPRG